nr:MAG TPA: hypothetical protein [Bacteriophage sp.]
MGQIKEPTPRVGEQTKRALRDLEGLSKRENRSKTRR